MENENIVKRVCKELNINQRELSELLGVDTSTVSVWSSGNIPKMSQLVLEQMLEIKAMKEQLSKLKAFKELLLDL